MRRAWSRAEEERVVALAKLCSAPRQLKQVHGHVVAGGHSDNNYVAARLIRSFAELGLVEHARAIGAAVPVPNAFVWTALIRACALSDSKSLCREALLLYGEMHRCPGAKPLGFTLSSVFKSCAKLVALEEGRQVHAHAIKHGFGVDPRVQTSLIDLYGSSDRLADARCAFDGLVNAGVHDVQAWNTMISGCAKAGDMEMARHLFDSMPTRNTFTWVEMINGYASLCQMDRARALLESGEKDVVTCTAMISSYARCGDLPAARSMFDSMCELDIAAWNAMISAYSHAGLYDDAIELFKLMLNRNDRNKVEPNHTTISTIVSICAHSGSPHLANWIQDYVERWGSKLLNNYTVAALIDLHCKCGDLERAHHLFYRWKSKDLICYSSMISGLGIHGRGKEAVRVFESARKAGLEPDAICFLSVLTACSHSGMVDEGRSYFYLMKDYNVYPSADHYMCIVDLLGRAGFINEAYKMITQDMPMEIRPHAGLWGALLSACRSYSNVEVGEVAAKHLMELEPENAGNYVLLSNIYAKAQRWDGVARIRALMRARGVKKPAGWSWVEIEGNVRRFMYGELYDDSLESLLELLDWELKDQGYLTSIELLM